MKQNLVIILLLLSAGNLIAQQDTTESSNDLVAQNEIKANGLILLFGAAEIAYERNLNAQSSAGVSVLVPFVDEDDIDWNINYYVSPYYRLFFGKKYAAGFFVEGFGMLNSKERERYSDSGNEFLGVEDVTDFGLGIGLGGKWVTKNGFVFEINGGLSRNLFNNSDYSGGEITGKIGFNLGYRF
jgi:hypothetical protein